jgi:acetyltransferase-like isoleucine patch superfamily enzyme
VKVGQDCIFDSTQEKPILMEIGAQANLSIGDNVYINEGFSVICNVSVTIGNSVLIAPDVVIMDDDGHPLDWATRHDYWPKKPQDRMARKVAAPIVIEDNVWIGTRAIILKGVTIGEGSVIAAGALVTRSIPAKVLVAGNPANMIRNL